ncbi:hypothetical protein ACJZ2D_000565 [Fusarium nematophilum]
MNGFHVSESRRSLSLPGGVDELIRRICEANLNTAVITEAGTAVAMHLVDVANNPCSWLAWWPENGSRSGRCPLRRSQPVQARLDPGEKKIELDKYAISVWSAEQSGWLAEAGTFAVIILQSAAPEAEDLLAHFKLPETFICTGL